MDVVLFLGRPWILSNLRTNTSLLQYRKRWILLNVDNITSSFLRCGSWVDVYMRTKKNAGTFERCKSHASYIQWTVSHFERTLGLRSLSTIIFLNIIPRSMVSLSHSLSNQSLISYGICITFSNGWLAARPIILLQLFSKFLYSCNATNQH